VMFKLSVAQLDKDAVRTPLVTIDLPCLHIVYIWIARNIPVLQMPIRKLSKVFLNIFYLECPPQQIMNLLVP
jgi:hypothetical protein